MQMTTDQIAAEAASDFCARNNLDEQTQSKLRAEFKSAIEKAVQQDREENLSFLELDYINKLRAAQASEVQSCNHCGYPVKVICLGSGVEQ